MAEKQGHRKRGDVGRPVRKGKGKAGPLERQAKDTPAVAPSAPAKSKTGSRARKPAGSVHAAVPPSPPARDAKQERRDAILAAGLRVFSERGFEAARLDDVAARAGVAKGTLYLYFTDKTALFEEIVRTAASPVRGQLEMLAGMPDLPTRALLQKLFGVFTQQVLRSDRKLVLRLVITEGHRFPAIAQFYHAEVVSHGLAMLTRIVERGIARGEIRTDALAQFPQLVMAPLLVSVLWDGLFQPFAPLDVERMLDAHLDILTGPSPAAQRRHNAP